MTASERSRARGAGGRRPGAARRGVDRRLDPEPARHQRAGRATVDNINARIRAWWVMALLFVVAVAAGPRRVDPALQPDLVSRAPRVRHARADRPGDHRALFWSLLRRHAAAVLPRLDRVVRPVQHPDPGLRLDLPRHPHRARGRHRALSRAHRDQPVGADDLRLLRELRAGAAHAAHPGLRAPERRADVLSRARRAVERRAAVRVGQDRRQAARSRRRSARTRPGKAWSAASVAPPRSATAIWWATPFTPAAGRR